jgi:hypothetical protein
MATRGVQMLSSPMPYTPLDRYKYEIYGDHLSWK